MKLRLYHYWRSSSSWRVRWAFSLKGIVCEFVAVNLLENQTETPDHLRRNPMGFVPVLEFLDTPTNERHRYLAESTAIIEWAEEIQPQPSLLPGTPWERARIRQLTQIINAGTQPLQNLGVNVLHSSDPIEQKRWNAYWTTQGLTAYEELVRETAGRFSFGDQLTLADLFLVPQCYNAGRQEVSLEAFPTVLRIYENSKTLPSYAESAPERFQP